ncbi:MAG: 3-methyl-2-oxobutanoate dehydrogenase subunit beta [Candidatus Cloacimonetes bacterium]|nr:3-methyl-2-oxobutanoate dehydrogenase subunit beta [Candidatus Cloacimonadota bacterium]
MKLTIPEKEVMNPGHLACQGCGGALAMRYALKVYGKNSMLTIPACCWAVIDGPFPYTTAGVPLFHTAFETAAVVGSGLRAGLKVQGNEETNVIAWAGDGGTFDIGLQAISGAAERNDDITYIVYDNEAYMNTGIQRSSATPHGAWTTTTPVKHYKKGKKKNIMEIMAAHRIPYSATASIAYPEDMIKKLKKAKETKGFKFLHVFAPCPTGWKSDPKNTIKLAKLAVDTNIFPLYEIIDGLEYTQTKKVKKVKPVKEYTKLQGRFKHLNDKEIQYMQEQTDHNYSILEKKFSD